MLPINLVAVSLAAVSAFVLGFLFHGPVTGKLWMKLANIHPTGNEKFVDMLPKLGWNLLVNFITAYMLAVLILFASKTPYLTGSALQDGIHLGLIVWFGFLVTATSIEVIWMGRTLKLWLFETACSLVVMAVMGAIIGAM